MAHAIDARPPHAGARVAEMQQWRGLVWGPQEPQIVLEDISLQSPPDAWPAVIRLDYRIGDRRARWEEAWGEELEAGSVEAAANLWLAIVHIPPDGSHRATGGAHEGCILIVARHGRGGQLIEPRPPIH